MTDEEEAGCHGSGTESDQDAKLDAKVLRIIWIKACLVCGVLLHASLF